MKLLLDANISWKLINILSPVFGECTHVDLINLSVPAKDIDIWNYALENKYIIITKDNDFLDLLELKGFPPKVILIKTGNNSTKTLAELIINVKSKIEDLENNNLRIIGNLWPIKTGQMTAIEWTRTQHKNPCNERRFIVMLPQGRQVGYPCGSKNVGIIAKKRQCAWTSRHYSLLRTVLSFDMYFIGSYGRLLYRNFIF